MPHPYGRFENHPAGWRRITLNADDFAARISYRYAMAEIKQKIHHTAVRGSEELDLSSSAIRLPVSRPSLIAVAVLICLLALAAAYLTTHGWSDAARDLSHAIGHLPKPLRILIGGSQLAHLLNPGQ